MDNDLIYAKFLGTLRKIHLNQISGEYCMRINTQIVHQISQNS